MDDGDVSPFYGVGIGDFTQFRLQGTTGDVTANSLAVWSDLNCDGKSDASEVRSVQELGITALSCNGQLNPDGTLGSANGVTFSDGRRADTYDVSLEQVK
ncbi:MAG: hypothetical protein JST89_15040 [Cyanobacteria bacterium SZAS-4]|nr:hypothetical protein [Cyanobacteria bacterium SZAS-4]